jgi:hypothetical protein
MAEGPLITLFAVGDGVLFLEFLSAFERGPMGPPRGGDLTVDDALEWNTIVCPSGDITDEGSDEGKGDGAALKWLRPVSNAGVAKDDEANADERGAMAADLSGIVGNLLIELLDDVRDMAASGAGGEGSRGGVGVLEYGGGWGKDVDGLRGCSVV